MNNQIKTILLTIIALGLLSSLCDAQTKPKPTAPEKQFYVPFTLKDLMYLNNQVQKTDSAAINGHNVMPTFTLLKMLLSTFNQAYNEQSQPAVKKDTVKKGEKGG
jgi:hypothetical protein